jgi:hypothetical protein
MINQPLHVFDVRRKQFQTACQVTFTAANQSLAVRDLASYKLARHLPHHSRATLVAGELLFF